MLIVLFWCTLCTKYCPCRCLAKWLKFSDAVYTVFNDLFFNKVENYNNGLLGHLIFRRTWLCNMLIFFSLWLEHSLIYRTVLVKRVGKLSSLSLVRAQWNSYPPLHLLWEYVYLVYISATATNGYTCFFTLNSQCKSTYVRDIMRFYKSVAFVMLNVWVYASGTHTIFHQVLCGLVGGSSGYLGECGPK